MVITRTPFRISFFGGGTDYPVWYKHHGGSVLSATINKYCYITTRYLPPFFKYNYRIRYTKRELTQRVDQIKHPSVRECLNFIEESNGIEMVHTSDLPAMSGLGSSSAFTVGFLNSLYALKNKKVSKLRLAQEAIHVEQNLIGESVGSQDQVNASFGGFNKIDFLTNNDILVKGLNLSDNQLLELEDCLELYFTGFQRHSSEVAAKIIKNAPKREKQLSQMNDLAKEGFKILSSKKSDLRDFGKLLDQNWQLKKSLASNVTNNIIDKIYEVAKEAGALGGKILGAGNGGFIIFFVMPENRVKVKEKLKKLLYVPFKFEFGGSQVIYQMPSEIENGYKG